MIFHSYVSLPEGNYSKTEVSTVMQLAHPVSLQGSLRQCIWAMGFLSLVSPIQHVATWCNLNAEVYNCRDAWWIYMYLNTIRRYQKAMAQHSLSLSYVAQMCDERLNTRCAGTARRVTTAAAVGGFPGTARHFIAGPGYWWYTAGAEHI